MFTPDMKKHPSSIARQAKIIFGIGGKFFKKPPMLCADFIGEWMKLR
jgi:hypothetical protein